MININPEFRIFCQQNYIPGSLYTDLNCIHCFLCDSSFLWCAWSILKYYYLLACSPGPMTSLRFCFISFLFWFFYLYSQWLEEEEEIWIFQYPYQNIGNCLFHYLCMFASVVVNRFFSGLKFCSRAVNV